MWKKNHGYDRPLLLNRAYAAADSRRYSDTLLFDHYRRMLSFDFGNSDADDSAIARRLREGMGPSLSLTVPLFTLGLVVGVLPRVVRGVFRETYIDRAVLVLCMLTMSIASLLYIIAGQYLIGMLLKWFPISGFAFDPYPGTVRFLALPVLVGVVAGIGADVRLYRTIFVEESSRDYVRTARAKGCGEARVMLRHVLRNALIPILSNIVIAIPFLFTGRAAAQILLRHSWPRLPHGGSHPGQRLLDPQDHGVSRGACYSSPGQILTDVSYAPRRSARTPQLKASRFVTRSRTCSSSCCWPGCLAGARRLAATASGARIPASFGGAGAIALITLALFVAIGLMDLDRLGRAAVRLARTTSRRCARAR